MHWKPFELYFYFYQFSLLSIVFLDSCTLQRGSSSRARPWAGESNKSCLLRGVKESDWVLDVSSSTPANSLRLQMRGSDDVGCGQIPLIKITMAENAATLARLCWGTTTLPLLKETWRGKVNSAELSDPVILLKTVYNTAVEQWFAHICHISHMCITFSSILLFCYF